MRKIAFVLAVVLASSGCSAFTEGGYLATPADTTDSPTGQPEFDSRWLAAVKDAGWTFNHESRAERRAWSLCGMDEDEARELAQLGLNDSEKSVETMRHRGIDKSEALDAYMDATNEYLC